VIDYLNKENDYYQQSTAHNERFSEEFIWWNESRIKEDDNPFLLIFITVTGILRAFWTDSYPIYSRKCYPLCFQEENYFWL
jgi:oligopeptidase B